MSGRIWVVVVVVVSVGVGAEFGSYAEVEVHVCDVELEDVEVPDVLRVRVEVASGEEPESDGEVEGVSFVEVEFEGDTGGAAEDAAEPVFRLLGVGRGGGEEDGAGGSEGEGF